MKSHASLILAFALGASALVAGCGGSDACVSQCRAAQDRSCTSIDNCDTFCNAIDEAAGAARCESQRDALERCGDSVDSCAIEASCVSEGNAFTSCIAPYCASSPTPSACTVIISGG